ncbi:MULTISPECIES: helix-turn-helix domain-containing protein [Methylorubrum]|uniref:helix-turn-helix domain-containing protein n=1 Tax=Methylorubrum TaxID=2282523 RepID=UPI00209F7589|nr:MULTISPECIES: helix-turn-helix domain-containing protein [Methylorubrum]MCP1550644.1 DNA-binding IclR family transcriptional regulator [Methylorubrum zatmanii]MCP1552743.1 DNA-binding IclR family transcriptional regulator [Methylorubrum extorquens]MCP1580947.1 DNA-binding IclR family transcriptional regulator [Methylorubrum extorquens]
MGRLSPSRLRVLRTLADYPQGGLLTRQLAEKIGLTTASARRLCQAMRFFGLVLRYETNDQRWWITDAGRAALAEQEKGDA